MISIVIPTYNRANSIGRAISSVISQTISDWELIIVDDGSTDNTGEIIKPFLSDARIKYIVQPNSGPEVARNNGANIASGEWLAFLDSDDEWLANKLELQLTLAEQSGDQILVYTNVNYIDEHDNIVLDLFKQKTVPKQGWVLRDLLIDNFVVTSSVMMPRALFEELGGFDASQQLKIGEDYELWLRVAGKVKFFYLTQPLVKYHVHGGQLTKNKFATYRNIIRLYLLLYRRVENYSQLTRSMVLGGLLKRVVRILFK